MNKETPTDIRPVEIPIKREDVAVLLLLNERQRRIAAEQRALDAEKSLLTNEQEAVTRRLSEEHGVDMRHYSINTSSGVATPIPQP